MSWALGFAEALRGLGTDVMRYGANRQDMQQQSLRNALERDRLTLQQEQEKRMAAVQEELARLRQLAEGRERDEFDTRRLTGQAQQIEQPVALPPADADIAKRLIPALIQDHSGAIPDARTVLPNTGAFQPAGVNLMPVTTPDEKRLDVLMAHQAQQQAFNTRKFEEQEARMRDALKSLDAYRDRNADAAEKRALAALIGAGTRANAPAAKSNEIIDYESALVRAQNDFETQFPKDTRGVRPGAPADPTAWIDARASQIIEADKKRKYPKAMTPAPSHAPADPLGIRRPR
jgi:hypothetical protein